MQVVEEPFDDVAGYERYVGVAFRFIFPDREIRARRYDMRGTASIFAHAIDGSSFEEIPYDDAEFREVAYYLRDTVVADNVDIFMQGGYKRLDFSQFPGSDKGDSQSEIIHCFQCRALIPEGQDRCPKCGWSWE